MDFQLPFGYGHHPISYILPILRPRMLHRGKRQPCMYLYELIKVAWKRVNHFRSIHQAKWKHVRKTAMQRWPICIFPSSSWRNTLRHIQGCRSAMCNILAWDSKKFQALTVIPECLATEGVATMHSLAWYVELAPSLNIVMCVSFVVVARWLMRWDVAVLVINGSCFPCP